MTDNKYPSIEEYEGTNSNENLWGDPRKAADVTCTLLRDYRDELVSRALHSLDDLKNHEHDTVEESLAGYALRVAYKVDSVVADITRALSAGYYPAGWTGELLHDLRFITRDNGFDTYVVANAEYVLHNTGVDYINGEYYAPGFADDECDGGTYYGFEWSRDVVFGAHNAVPAHDDCPFA